MKVFKFRFSKLTLTFIYVGLALAVVALGLTVYNIFNTDYVYNNYAIYTIIGQAAMILVAVLMIVILVSLLISSYYSVGDKIIKTSFGLIKSKFKIDNIEKVVLDRASNKLAVYFKDNSFIMIVVKPEWYEEFINEILKNNPNIEYTINSVQNSPDDNLKK